MGRCEVAPCPAGRSHAQVEVADMIIAVAGAFGLARGRDKAEPRFGAGREAGQRLRVGTQRDDKIPDPILARRDRLRSEEHTSDLQSLMRISYAVFCLT